MRHPTRIRHSLLNIDRRKLQAIIQSLFPSNRENVFYSASKKVLPETGYDTEGTDRIGGTGIGNCFKSSRACGSCHDSVPGPRDRSRLWAYAKTPVLQTRSNRLLLFLSVTSCRAGERPSMALGSRVLARGGEVGTRGGAVRMSARSSCRLPECPPFPGSRT